MGDKFVDDGRTIFDFGGRFLVRCPRCFHRAEVMPKDMALTDIFAPRRFSCLRCGLTREWATHVSDHIYIRDGQWSQKPEPISIGGPHDWYFRYSLWLQTSCCGRVLWAYNAAHLHYLNQCIGARVREQEGVSNFSLASRLPKWIKTAKNRDAVLKGLDRLDALLLGS